SSFGSTYSFAATQNTSVLKRRLTVRMFISVLLSDASDLQCRAPRGLPCTPLRTAFTSGIWGASAVPIWQPAYTDSIGGTKLLCSIPSSACMVAVAGCCTCSGFKLAQTADFRAATILVRFLG